MLDNDSKNNVDDVWVHPMNSGIPQKNIQHFNTIKAYLDAIPKDENGRSEINGKEFQSLLNAFGGKPIEISNQAPD